ncbi:insulinase family protein [bacterium]|nr:insulinase family protein [bacterium]
MVRQSIRRMRFAFPVVATLVAMSAIAAAGMRQVQLDSGLTLIAIHDGWCDISAVSVMVDAGSRYDPDERGGLAQLTNEMLFEGTRDATWEEIADELDRLSIRYGALTSEDYAEVYITSHETEFDTALEWLSEFMLRPAFDEERLDREKEIAIGSFESEMNDAFTRTYHSLSGLLFPGHPYSRPVLGTPESVRAATRDEILSFYEQHYGASNTVVVVVGDFDVDEMVAGLEVLFAGYPARDVRRREPSPVELEGPVGLNIYHEGEQGFVEIGFLGPEIGSDDYAAVQVMVSALGDGSGSRLSGCFGDSDPAQLCVAGAFVSVRSEGVRLVAYASSDDADGTLQTLNEEIEGMRTVAVSAVELEQAKSRIETRFAAKTETNRDKASAIARRYLLGLPQDFREMYLDRLESVTADDVERVARTYLVNPATVVERPGEPPSRGI